MGKSKINPLESEKSPHLRKHASDAVFWQPWSEKALNQAREQQKHIFLSLDRANSYLSSLQDSDVFTNKEIAERLNELFICIKMDADEHPHLAKLFCTLASQLTSVDLLLPINLILSPDRIPIYATGCLGNPILHKRNSHGKIEITSVFELIQFYENNPKVAKGSLTLSSPSVQQIKELRYCDYSAVCSEWFKNLQYDATSRLFDFQYPQFLMNFGTTNLDWFTLTMTSRQLKNSATMSDYLHGGFWDKSNDTLNAHKSLSNNSEALIAYTMASLIYPEGSYFGEIAKQIANFLLRTLRSPENGFCNGIGGKREKASWTRTQVFDCIGKNDDTILFCDYLELPNKDSLSIIFPPLISIEVFAQRKKQDLFILKEKFEQFSRSLRLHRKNCELEIDPIIYTATNGRAIAALAYAGMIFQNKTYLQASVRAAEFVKSHLFQENELLRRYVEGVAELPALLEDYAQMIRGCIALFEAGQGTCWLKWATTLAKTAFRKFFDEDGLFFYKDFLEDPAIKSYGNYLALAKKQSLFSGISVLLKCLGNPYFFTKDDELICTFKQVCSTRNSTIDLPEIAYELFRKNHNRLVLVIRLDDKESTKEELLSLLSENFVPHLQIVWLQNDDSLPIFHNLKLIDDKTTVFAIRGKNLVFAGSNWEAIQRYVKAVNFAKYSTYPEEVEKLNNRIESSILSMLNQHGEEWKSTIRHPAYYHALQSSAIVFEKQIDSKTDPEDFHVYVHFHEKPMDMREITYHRLKFPLSDEFGRLYYEFIHEINTSHLSLEFCLCTYEPLTDERTAIWRERFSRFVKTIEMSEAA